MGRVRSNVIVAGQSFWALFDSGARNTYVVEEVASLLLTFPMARPEPVALAGRVHTVERGCNLTCLIDGFTVEVRARVLPEIGVDEQGKRIEILLGALAMQEWGIALIPQEERLDMTHYPREFVEFCEMQNQPVVWSGRADARADGRQGCVDHRGRWGHRRGHRPPVC
jgi:hypothetical protein